jgi:hypothetical protein
VLWKSCSKVCDIDTVHALTKLLSKQKYSRLQILFIYFELNVSTGLAQRRVVVAHETVPTSRNSCDSVEFSEFFSLTLTNKLRALSP